MRASANTFDGCSVIWAIAFSAIGAFLLFAAGLGFFSLILVGLVLADACLNSELTLDYPLVRRRAERLYGPERLAREQQAARAAVRHADIRCLHAGRWCGLSVAVAGVAGLWWCL
jgi:hypothetical protein